LFRPKTNIRQENAAEYSADHEYLAQSSKHCKNVNLSNNYFLGWQLILKIYEQQKHTVHETLTMSTKWVFSRKKRAYIEIESYKIRFFSFLAALAEHSFQPIVFSRILGQNFLAEYLAENVFGRSPMYLDTVRTDLNRSPINQCSSQVAVRPTQP
jgi:hypothetical protein